MSEANVQVNDISPERVFSSEQFAAQFEESFRKLWLIAVGIARNAALADDILQEAAIVALSKLDQYRPGTNFAAWMGQTVRYVALNQSRKERRRRVLPLDETVGNAASSESEARPRRDTLALSARGELPAGQPDFDDQIVKALSAASETARACLLLRTVESLEYSEISRILDIPEGTAMSHVHRTRRLLRERLAPSPPAAAHESKR